MSYIGTNKVGKMYLGSTAIGKAYLGSDLVYNSASGLPYDAEIEYLQSSGAQYIDTGVAVTSNNVTIKIKYQLVTSSDDSAIFGAMTSNNTCWFAEQFGNMWWIGTSGQLFSNSQGTTLHTVEWNLQNGVVSGTVDGINYSGRYNGTVESGTNVHLFCTKQGANVIRESSVKIYYFSITDNGNEVLNMIPVRVGQVGYMYDRVSRQLIGNAGSGDFALGGDIIGNGAYVKCSYVVPSSSSAIFTTGVTALGSKWELDLQDSVTTSGNQVFICSNDSGVCFAAVNSSGKFALGTSNVMTSASTRTTVGIEFIDKGMIMTIGSENAQRVGATSHNQYVSLLGYNGNYLYQGKIYVIKCVSGGSFDAVPARRVSDGVYGLYDTANDIFYTNFTGA